MTDPTNHAEVIRDYLEDPMMSAGPSKALAALDALTREMEADIEEGERLNRAMCEQQADVIAQAECIATLTARIATLEEVLENLVSWVENMGEFDLEDPVWFATVREARAALAPKEAQG